MPAFVGFLGFLLCLLKCELLRFGSWLTSYGLGHLAPCFLGQLPPSARFRGLTCSLFGGMLTLVSFRQLSSYFGTPRLALVPSWNTLASFRKLTSVLFGERLTCPRGRLPLLVMAGVLGVSKQLQVFQSVVRMIAIQMVNIVSRGDRSMGCFPHTLMLTGGDCQSANKTTGQRVTYRHGRTSLQRLWSPGPRCVGSKAYGG